MTVQEIRKANFAQYLEDRYDYISKFDMLKDEKETRVYHQLSIAEAIECWNKVYQV